MASLLDFLNLLHLLSILSQHVLHLVHWSESVCTHQHILTFFSQLIHFKSEQQSGCSPHKDVWKKPLSNFEASLTKVIGPSRVSVHNIEMVLFASTEVSSFPIFLLVIVWNQRHSFEWCCHEKDCCHHNCIQVGFLSDLLNYDYEEWNRHDWVDTESPVVNGIIHKAAYMATIIFISHFD